jgi:hypothetical protein
MDNHLFSTSPIMNGLQQLWYQKYDHLRFVDTEKLAQTELPHSLEQFEQIVNQYCQEAKNHLQTV